MPEPVGWVSEAGPIALLSSPHYWYGEATIMGTWGIGIMDNDLAQDVKDAFEDALAETGSTLRAARRVRRQYQEDLDEFDEYPDLVLALAWLLSARGRADKALFGETVKVIREGLSLRRWEDSPEYEERRQKEQEFLEVLEGRAPHPEPYKRPRRIRVKVGDIFEIALSDGRKAYCQYVFFDPMMGELVQVFNLITRETPSLEAILASGPKFPPVFTVPSVGVEQGTWRVIGNVEVKDFKYPMFKAGNEDSQGRVSVWWLYDGGREIRVGKLPPGAERYEFRVVWAPVNLTRRIETGENYYDRLR